MNINSYGQLIGDNLEDWVIREAPTGENLDGAHCRLERLRAGVHAADLYSAFSLASDSRDWTYTFAGPFKDLEEYRGYIEKIEGLSDPMHYAVIDSALGKAVGTLSLMRIDRTNGTVEVGAVAFSPLLKRKVASTEAQYLLMRHVFEDLGYRRYEWKCDSLNMPSRNTAKRLGFSFEGVFRQAVVYKGRSRDTAWFSVIDKEWPLVKAAFQAWLSVDNFEENGEQKRGLFDIREELRSSHV